MSGGFYMGCVCIPEKQTYDVRCMYMNSLVMSSYYIVASYDEVWQKARKGELTSDIQTEEEGEAK